MDSGNQNMLPTLTSATNRGGGPLGENTVAAVTLAVSLPVQLAG